MKYHGKIVYPFLIFVIYLTEGEVLDKDFYMQSTSQTLKVISELPSQNDVYQYISALRRLVKFLSEHTVCLDFSMKFGLFLLNVNLRSFLQDDNLIPSSLRNEVKYLVDEADKLHFLFDNKMNSMLQAQPKDYAHSTTAMYISMLTNDSEWSQHILRLDLDLLREIYSNSLKFPEWNKYEFDLENPLKLMPDMTLGNICLGQLASSHDEVATDFPRCKLKANCLEMLDFGNNYGYMLSFKLLFLLLARLSRRCTVFSTLQDERVRHHLCKSAYRESEFIAANNFRKVDLMAEHVSFCTLDGHAQFLRTSWMTLFLSHQTPYGYFTSDVSPANIAAIQDRFEKKQKDPKMEGACLEHINAVMVGALSAAMRYILENYH